MIASTHNPRVAAAARLARRPDRERERAFLVEGPQAVEEALGAGAGIRRIFHDPAEGGDRVAALVAAATAAGIPVDAASPDVIRRLATTVTPQGVVAVCGFVDAPLASLRMDGEAFLPVLWEVRDPGNLGTIVRSADASGASGVIVTDASVDPYNPKAVRASAGSLFHLPLVRGVPGADAVAALRARGARVLALTAEGDRSLFEVDLEGPIALLLGNEARGLPGGALEAAEERVRVPMAGRAESLNLAAAAAVALFECARRRGAARPAPAGDGGPAGSAAWFASLVREGAHDARTPAATMRGFAAMLGERWEAFEDPKRREMVDAIRQDADRVSVLLARLHEAARLAGGGLERDERGEPLALVPLVREAALAAGDTPVEVAVQPGADVRVRAGRERLRAMLAAVVETARWSGREGPVRVEVRPPGGDGVEVRASRAGGTNAEGPVDLARADASRSGNRLAAFVAEGLARSVGGSLEARGTADGGLQVALTLPVAGGSAP